MDVTCGIMFSTDSSTMAQLECALLSSNFDDIEKYANKLKKKREISLTLEIVLECYVGIHRQIRLHAASLELDLSHILAYQIKPEISLKLKEKLKKVLMMDVDGGSEFELKLSYVLLGLLGLFSFDGGKESLNDSLAYFDKIDFDLSKKFLLYEQGDTEITQSSLIEKIFGILGLYFRGVALELQGRKDDACDQYQVITDFLFRFRVQQFTQSKSVHDFICAALYRSGCLLNQLAQFRESAAIFRSFLNFYQVNPQNQMRQPTNSTIRLLRALSQYLDLLDRKFRKYNFKTFCDEQQPTNNNQAGNINSPTTFRVENVQEEIILCCMLLESIEQNSLVKQILEDLRLETNVLRRFARIGYLEGITRIQKTRFQTSVANLNIYRNLFHSLMSAGKLDKAILTAEMYLQGNGKDPFTLLLISKLYLTLPSKIDESFKILNEINCENLDLGMQIPYFLLRGKYFLIKSRKECSIVKGLKEDLLSKSNEEFKLVLQVDENNAEAHFYLSLLSCEGGNEDIEEAEKHVKKSLSLDSSQIRAWNLFALIKSIKKDYEAVLSICNSELSNMIQKDLNLSLLKVSTLMALNKSDEAIELLKRIISAHFRKSNDLKMDGGMTVISEGTLGPGSFLSKFLGDLNGSIYDLSCEGDSEIGSGTNYHRNSLNLDILTGTGKLTTFQEYTESFPSTLNEFLLKKACDSEGVTRVLPLEDLKVITNNNSNNITLLWIEVAKVYLQEGLLQDAEAAVSQAYQSNEIFSPIFAAFASIEESKGFFGEAEEFYRKGLSIDSEDESCLLGLSRVHLRSQNPSKVFEAESMIHKLIRRDPNIAEAWSILAQCCSLTGRNEEALKYFEIALKKESTTPLRSIRSIPIQ